MDPRQIAILSTRLLLVWLIVSILFLYIGNGFVSTLFPFLDFFVELYSGSYSSILKIEMSSELPGIHMTSTITDAIYIEKIPVAPPGYKLASQIHVIHALVPVVIFLTIIFSWPARNLMQRLVYTVVSLFGLFLLLALTIPVLLVGHIEMNLMSAARNFSGQELGDPFIIKWMIFLETGGSWLVALLFAMLCIGGVKLLEGKITIMNR